MMFARLPALLLLATCELGASLQEPYPRHIVRDPDPLTSNRRNLDTESLQEGGENDDETESETTVLTATTDDVTMEPTASPTEAPTEDPGMQIHRHMGTEMLVMVGFIFLATLGIFFICFREVCHRLCNEAGDTRIEKKDSFLPEQTKVGYGAV